VHYRAECDQLNLALVTSNKIKQQTKTNKRQCPLSSGSRSEYAVQNEPERLCRKGFVKQMSFKCRVKDRGSDRWWE